MFPILLHLSVEESPEKPNNQSNSCRTDTAWEMFQFGSWISCITTNFIVKRTYLTFSDMFNQNIVMMNF